MYSVYLHTNSWSIKILAFFEIRSCLGSAALKVLKDEKQKLWAIKFVANALKCQ